MAAGLGYPAIVVGVRSVYMYIVHYGRREKSMSAWILGVERLRGKRAVGRKAVGR